MKIFKSITLLILLCLILIYLLDKPSDTKVDNYLDLGDKKIYLIEVSGIADRVKGLSGMERLPEDKAMLFTFDTAEKHGIWMKDMKFSIDILWIDQNYQIVSIEEGVSPNTYPKVFYPTEKSTLVLEANAGFVKRNNLKVGNFLNFNQK